MNCDFILITLICALKFIRGQNSDNPLMKNDTFLMKNIQLLETTEIKKNTVKKRPGVPIYPLPMLATLSTVNTEDTFPNFGVKNDVKAIKNSTIVHRKGAGNPPPLSHIAVDAENNLNILADEKANIKNIGNHNSSKFSSTKGVKIEDYSNYTSFDRPIKHGSSAKTISKLNISLNATSHETLVSTNAPIPFTSATYEDSTLEPHTEFPAHSTEFLTQSDNFNLTEDDVTISAMNTLLRTSPHNSFAKPSTASAGASSDKFSSVTGIIIAVLIVLAVCFLLGFITYKRLYAYWNRRHYSRVDFLIDGLYEM